MDFFQLPIFFTEKLGFRLETEAQENQELLNNAHLCYISSGSLEKLVSSWSNNVYKSTKDLKELVELVVLLQKALERQGKQVLVSLEFLIFFV